MMNEEKKNKNKNFIKEVIVILVVGLLINFFCFFVCSITGHCANLDGNSYFPFLSGETTGTVYVNESFIEEQFNDGAWFIYSYADPSSSYPRRTRYIVLKNVSTTSPDPNLHLYGEIMSGYGGSHFSLYWSTSSQVNYDIYYYLDWGDGREITNSSYDSNTLRPFYNLNSALNNDNVVYYTKKNVMYLATDEVLIYAPAEEIQIGEFVDLPGIDEILNNISNSWESPSSVTGHALPSTPTENPNNTDFDNRLQMFQYLANTITQNFGNLGYNLAKWFNGVQQKLTDVANSISQNIYNGFRTLMDNIRDFFGPKIDAIIEALSWFFEPFSTEELADNLDNGSFSSDILGLTSSITTFGESLTSGTEPNSCKFTLDFSNSYYNFGVCEFSLDWILPMRPGIRLIIGCLCVYSLIVSIFTSLNTYIGGTSSINDDI